MTSMISKRRCRWRHHPDRNDVGEAYELKLVRDPPITAAVVNAETVTGSAKMFYYKQWIIYKQAIVYKNQYVSILQALEMLIPAKTSTRSWLRGIEVNNDKIHVSFIIWKGENERIIRNLPISLPLSQNRRIIEGNGYERDKWTSHRSYVLIKKISPILKGKICFHFDRVSN